MSVASASSVPPRAAVAAAALDVLWNVALGLAAAAVVARSRAETPAAPTPTPRTPLRLWVAGYALQCLLHAACAIVDHFAAVAAAGAALRNRGGLSVVGAAGIRRLARHLESAATAFSFLWWIIGFYLVSSGVQRLTKDAPLIHWLCVGLLSLDVFFVVFCITLAYIVGVPACCSIPCIMAILYDLLDQEGATGEDILQQLPRCRFSSICSQVHLDPAAARAPRECRVRRSGDGDGGELPELRRGHRLHLAGAGKWLRITASYSYQLCKCSVTQAYQDELDEV